jgi:hypothetical protein
MALGDILSDIASIGGIKLDSQDQLTLTTMRVNKAAKEITFGAQAFPVSSSVNSSEIQNISEQANAKLGNFFMEVDTRTRHGPILFSLHAIKYQDVVPKRMLLRAAREFSSAFETAVSMDKYNYLKSALN